ncbi:MAG: AAA family ATPase, partial [Nannocystaceae bacterium]
ACCAAGASHMQGWSGAEIEAAITEARLSAFAQGRPVAAKDLQSAMDATVPMSRSHAESIHALLEWARTRARLAAD